MPRWLPLTIVLVIIFGGVAAISSYFSKIWYLGPSAVVGGVALAGVIYWAVRYSVKSGD